MDDMSTPTHSHQHSLSHFFFDTAAMLLTFVSLGKYLESRVKGQTSRALTVLAGLQPKSALLLPNYGACLPALPCVPALACVCVGVWV